MAVASRQMALPATKAINAWCGENRQQLFSQQQTFVIKEPIDQILELFIRLLTRNFPYGFLRGLVPTAVRDQPCAGTPPSNVLSAPRCCPE